jgi:hypothetical protein
MAEGAFKFVEWNNSCKAWRIRHRIWAKVTAGAGMAVPGHYLEPKAAALAYAKCVTNVVQRIDVALTTCCIVHALA